MFCLYILFFHKIVVFIVNRLEKRNRIQSLVYKILGMPEEITVERRANLNFSLFFALTIICCGFAVAVGYGGTTVGALILAATIGIPCIYFIVVYPKFGVITLLVAAYFIMFIARLGVNFPVGVLMDAIQFLLIVGVLIKQKRRSNWGIFKNPITTIIVIWMAYNFLQIVNPTTEVRLAWVYNIRSVAVVMLMYFVFIYNITSISIIRLVLKLWIGLTLFAALYALKQEFIGFFSFEQAYLDSDPRIKGLLFINGHWRRFSIFSDPVAFSYNMVATSVLCITLIFGPYNIKKKIVLGMISLVCLIAMFYSGTRAAYVLLPGSMVVLLILKFNKQVLTFALIFGLLFAALIFVPTSNATIYRFQTAFKPSNDASFNVRKDNQKRIQPFIQSHPLGGGLGAVTAVAKKIAPHALLSNFPPDSGYVRVAVELGWIGLFLFCTLFFVILKTGIDNYYKIQNPELKNYCLAMVLITFAFHIASYPQEAIVQFPASIYFYLVVALIPITYQLDRQEQQSNKLPIL